MNAFQKVREALEAHGSKIQDSGPDRFVAQCPSHNDGRPSLSVRSGDRGALLFCFAGCETKQITEDLGLRDRDLFDSSEITYDYRDLSGSLTKTVVRKPGKDWTQRGPRTKGTAPLYRLESVVEAVQAGTPIYLAEGEKDVHHLEAAGAIATCTAGGAGQAKYADLSPLEGAEIRIVPDRDPEGAKYARTLWELLSTLASSVTFWEVPVGKDFSDSFTAGYGLADLQEYVPDFVTEREEERPHRRIVSTRFSDVKPLPVRWLWDRRIPLGMVTVMAGREGLGKSTFSAWIAAQVTRGTLEGDVSEPRDVLWVTLEEGLEYELNPRLTAAGADLNRLHKLDVVTEIGTGDSLKFPADSEELERFAKEHRAALVVFDPIMSSLSQSVDTHKEHSLRSALDLLAVVARNANCSVLALHHMNKSRVGDLGDRMTGARTFSNVARSVLGLHRDPEDPTERRKILTLAKANLTEKSSVPGILFTTDSCTVETEVGPTEVGAARILGVDSRTTNEILAALDALDGSGEDHDEATDWLRDYLTDKGGSAPRAEILRDAKKEGYTEAALRGPAKKLKVQKKRQGYQAGSVWILPEFVADPPSEESPSGSTSETVVEFPLQAVLQETARECKVRNCTEPEALDVHLGGITWGVCEVHSSLSLAIRSRGDGLEVVA